jgi:hypothetical protein
MSKKVFDIIRKRGLRAIFLTPHTVKHASEESEGTFTSYKIHQALAKRLERRGVIMEAIQMYRLAANIYPIKGYESLKTAAELAQKFSLHAEAAKLWFESIYYSHNVDAKLESLIQFVRELLRSLINVH